MNKFNISEMLRKRVWNLKSRINYFIQLFSLPLVMIISTGKWDKPNICDMKRRLNVRVQMKSNFAPDYLIQNLVTVRYYETIYLDIEAI